MTCTKCDLFIGRKNVVVGEGDTRSNIMFIGEAPGRTEDTQGKPFQGQLGKHLDLYLAVAGLTRDDCYLTNVVKCRPINNAIPTWNQSSVCSKLYLKDEMTKVMPKLIVLLGNVALKTIIGNETVYVNKERHKWFTYSNNTFFTCTFHPSTSLRSKAIRPNMIADFLMIGEAYNKLVNPFVKPNIQAIKDLVLKYCVKDGRTLFIPCFALDRTPYILWLLYSMFGDDLTFFTRIIVDSPLAIRLLDDYGRELKGEAKKKFDKMMNWQCIELSRTAISSAEAMDDGEPKVVISSSGMLDAGRGIRWAKRLLPNKQDCILFIGYVAPTSNAYRIQNNKSKTVILNGDTFNVYVNLVSLGSFSGHMQRSDLLNYYSNINCETVYLVHSNKDDKEGFAIDLRSEISRKNRSNKVVCVDYNTKIVV